MNDNAIITPTRPATAGAARAEADHAARAARVVVRRSRSPQEAAELLEMLGLTTVSPVAPGCVSSPPGRSSPTSGGTSPTARRCVTDHDPIPVSHEGVPTDPVLFVAGESGYRVYARRRVAGLVGPGTRYKTDRVVRIGAGDILRFRFSDRRDVAYRVHLATTTSEAPTLETLRT